VKIGIISDLHVDLNNPQLTESVQDALVRVVKERGSELLLIGGDISNNCLTTLRVLEEIEQAASVPCLFVPGNHDIWNIEHPGKKAHDTYGAMLAYPRNLARETYSISDKWVVIGDIGWYDYAFADPSYSHEELDQMQRGERTWKDKLYSLWDKPTLEVNDYFVEKLKRQLEANRHRNIILMTHVVPHEAFAVPMPHDEWGYFNAFLGSRRIGELIETYTDSVRYAVCGHVHYRKTVRLGRTEVICNCLGYVREWLHAKDDAYKEIAEAYVEIEIEA